MKKFLLTITCISLVSVSIFAQQTIDSIKSNVTENNSVTTSKIEEKSSVFINGSQFNFIFSWHKTSEKNYPSESHWTGLGLGLLYLNGLNGVNQGTSKASCVNFMDYVIPINKHWLFATGLGFGIQNYKFKGNVYLKNDDNGVTRFIYGNSNEYGNSRFKLYHITIPFIVEYQTRNRKIGNFFIHAGIEALIKTSSSSRAEIHTAEGVRKEKYRGLNIHPLNARFVLRTGIRNFSIMASYQPFSIFKTEGGGADTKPYGIGLMIDF
ncbi:MAG: PorT family protein [Prevotellaceae bacterium]|jgi:hypothetical protein|nr:PorT family protein [Prevotellaceae bacterium]